MAEVVNLRLARKRKAREERESAAAERRFEHGRGAGERARTESERALREKKLDGLRREIRDAEGGSEP